MISPQEKYHSYFMSDYFLSFLTHVDFLCLFHNLFFSLFNVKFLIYAYKAWELLGTSGRQLPMIPQGCQLLKTCSQPSRVCA